MDTSCFVGHPESHGIRAVNSDVGLSRITVFEVEANGAPRIAPVVLGEKGLGGSTSCFCSPCREVLGFSSYVPLWFWGLPFRNTSSRSGESPLAMMFKELQGTLNVAGP